MNMKVMRRIGWMMLAHAVALAGSAATTVEMSTPEFALSISQSGRRASRGSETLTYSSRWDGDDESTVTLAQDGATLAEGLTNEGAAPWSVTRNGTYTLTHTTYTNGVAGKVETATFVVSGLDEPFTPSDVTLTGYAGVYDGLAHGISVSVADGIAGVTKKFATDSAAVFTEALPTIRDVGSLTVWCEISAPGYITQTNSATMMVTPRPVTLTSKSAAKVYDGTPLTAHEVTVSGDGFVGEDGATYTFMGEQTAVGESANTFTYTLNANTAAGNYEIATVNGTLAVIKATVGPGGGSEPGPGELPSGGVSKFDATAVYDGAGHTIKTNELVAAFAEAMAGADETKVGYGYAADGTAATAREEVADWREVALVYTNAGEYVVWYKVTNPNYEDFVHQAKLTITPRDIANATIAPIPDVTFADRPVTPAPVVTDQTPSIIKSSDYTVSYRDNDRPGTATVTLVGRGNYRGTKSATFVIRSAPVLYAALGGTLAWRLNTGTGCYTAQLKLTCTNGFSQGISDLKFVYQDRVNGAKITSGLWDSSARAYRPTASLGGTDYRFVDLDATRITGEGVTALYGVADVSQAVGTVPAAECAIELFVSDLSSPVSDIGYVLWKSNGRQCSLPVSAAGGSQGLAVRGTMLQAVCLAASAPLSGMPLSTAALNASLAFGVVVDPESSPYCRLADFAVTAAGLRGRVEVGKARDGNETRGALGANARVVLMGAKSLSDGFAELGRVSVDERGAFTFLPVSVDCRFFRVRIDVENVVE